MWLHPARMDRAWMDRDIGAVHFRAVREVGTTTAEYAIVTMAAVAFGSTLVAIVRSGTVRALLVGLVQRALSVV
jgi:hypothetical protein